MRVKTEERTGKGLREKVGKAFAKDRRVRGPELLLELRLGGGVNVRYCTYMLKFLRVSLITDHGVTCKK